MDLFLALQPLLLILLLLHLALIQTDDIGANILVLNFEQVLLYYFFRVFTEACVEKSWLDGKHNSVDLVLVLLNAVTAYVGIESKRLIIDQRLARYGRNNWLVVEVG